MKPRFPDRAAGLLFPVFALRRKHDLGIGDTAAVKEAIDFCASHGFKVFQTLPIHDVAGDFSPYNPISSRALSHALLTLEEDQVPGLSIKFLTEKAPESWLEQLREGSVKHRIVHKLKLEVLLEAAERFFSEGSVADKGEFEQFQTDNADWLPGFTLFRLLVLEYDVNPHWEQWQPQHHSLSKAESWLQRYEDRERLETLRRGLAFIQWVAHKQWIAVRAHADAKGVLLMGEMSFGVSKSSADVWCHPELFDIEWSMGTKPVVYFDTNKDSERWGQNWGLPPYRWENHRSEDFAWLRQRVQSEAQYFHICRLDHLRGYFRAYMFPWQGGTQHAEFATLTDEEARVKTGGRFPRFVPGSDDDEITAKMNDLQGREIISVVREAAGEMFLFAELMGKIPSYMRQALEDLQMPNLTFPLLETKDDGDIQPMENFRPLSLVSYGNHDHAALAAVYLQLKEKSAQSPQGLANLLTFAHWTEAPPEAMTSELLAALQKALLQTPCMLAVFMCVDLLGTLQRFNLPGTYGDLTWCERLEHTLEEFERHSVYGPRISKATALVQEADRPASTS